MFPAPFEYQRARSIDEALAAPRRARRRRPHLGRRSEPDPGDAVPAGAALPFWSTSIRSTSSPTLRERRRLAVGAMARDFALESRAVDRAALPADRRRVAGGRRSGRPPDGNRRRQPLPQRSGRRLAGRRARGARAIVVRATKRRTRTVAIDDFIVDSYTTAVGDGEMAIEVRFPDARTRARRARIKRSNARSATLRPPRRRARITLAADGTIARRRRSRSARSDRRRCASRRPRSCSRAKPSKDLIAAAAREAREARRPVRRQSRVRGVQEGDGGRPRRTRLDHGIRTSRRGRLEMKISVTVNGTEYERDVEPRMLLAYFLREDRWADRHARRLRFVELRLLRRRARRRSRGEVVHDVRRAGRRPRDHDGRGTRAGRKAASAAAGVLGPARLAVRLLHARHADDVRTCCSNTIPNRASARSAKAISGNLCRCTGYQNIVKAVQQAASEPRRAGGSHDDTVELPEASRDRRRDEAQGRSALHSRARAAISTTSCCPNMLYLALVHSPYPHARIKNIDKTRGARVARA